MSLVLFFALLFFPRFLNSYSNHTVRSLPNMAQALYLAKRRRDADGEEEGDEMKQREGKVLFPAADFASKG